VKAWEALRATAYVRTRMNVRHSLQMRPGPELYTDIEASPRYRDILADLYAAAPALGKRSLYRNDLVEVGAQYLGVRIDAHLHAARDAQRTGDAATRDAEAKAALDGMRRLDALLELRPDLRLQGWIDAARRSAPRPELADDYERDARTQVSIWGSTELFDYASKLWSGLVRDFYARRWEQYFALLRQGATPEAARAEVARWEAGWARGTGLSAPAPARDLLDQVRELLADQP
jgi:alpha-N-acetylglucosaminidase